MTSPAPVPTAAVVALVSRDQPLVGDVRRLCAVAGVRLDVATTDADVRRGWRAAATVLVDGSHAAAVAATGLPRRPGVLVVTRDDLDGVQPWRDAVGLGADAVLGLPADERRLLELIVDVRTEVPDRASRVVACRGGHGGAGATTLAVAVAVAGRRRGLRTVLVDGDPAAGGLDLVLGAERAEGIRWPALAVVRGRVDAAALDAALPEAGELGRLLSGDRGHPVAPSAEAMRVVLDALERVNDLVVVDVASAFDEAALVALEACDLGLLAVAARVRSVAAAAAVATASAGSAADLKVVVHRPAGAALRSREVAVALGLDLFGEVAFSPRVAAAADRGELARAVARGGFAAVAERAVSAAVAHPARRPAR